MAKFKEKIQAQNLRQKGQSIKEIADLLKVSKGTASVWCRDIKLSNKQIAALNEKMNKASYIGRMKGAKIQKEKRLKKIIFWEQQGRNKIKYLTAREKLLLGLGLYWGEGTKKENKVLFSNSDPRIIKFMLSWFNELFAVSNDNFSFQIGINIYHKKRIREVENYWCRITRCQKKQFVKPSFKKVKNKKIYKNKNEHFGTLRIGVRKSSELLYKINGLINAINMAA